MPKSWDDIILNYKKFLFKQISVLSINTPTILYIQHTSNAIGIEKKDKNMILKKILNLKKTIKTNINSITTLKAISTEFSYTKYFQAKLRTILLKKNIA